MSTKFDLYERVTPLAGLGIWERNLQTGEIYWNSIVREILEVDSDSPLELEDVFQIYNEPEQVRSFVARAMHTGEALSGSFDLTTKNGHLKWVKVRIQCQFKENSCTAIYGTIEDITENAQLLNEVQEKEKRFTQAFDHAPIGMALVSPVGQWIRVNENLCKLLGYSEAELLQRTFQEFTYPDDLHTDLEQMQQLLAGKIDRYSMEKRYFHANGQIIWALLSVSLVRDAKGNPLYFISQVKDISERKKSMQIISEQNGRLLNFAHIISHNLRSHTGNIRMLTTMIKEEADLVEKDHLIDLLEVNASNLLETLDNLNEVVKIHDKGVDDVAELNLKHQVDRVLDILSASIKTANASVRVSIAADIEVRYNPAYLESILINLLTNSLKYKHPDRLPVIDISARATATVTYLTVSDNGLGIDLSIHGEKLFGMYKTFHKHADARGMGLFLVKNHVEAMGGKIDAESEPGKGMTFTIEMVN